VCISRTGVHLGTLVISPQHGFHRKHRFEQLFYCSVCVCYGHHVTAFEPLPSKRACLQICSLAKAVSAGLTILAFSRHATTSRILRTEREVCPRMLGLSQRRGRLSVRLITASVPSSGREGHKAKAVQNRILRRGGLNDAISS
jgi:hypothetical protein